MKNLPEIKYDPSDIRNGSLKDLWSQMEMMILQRELRVLYNNLPEEYVESELQDRLEELFQLLRQRLLPPFQNNPLLGYNPGTKEWDRQVNSIHRQYLAYFGDL